MPRISCLRGRRCLPLFFAALFVLAACSPGDAPEQAAGTEVVVAIESFPTNLDPRLSTDAYSERIGQLMFSKLVRTGPNMEVTGDLAASWETPTPTTYLFHLKSGFRFHDGTPVTAQDVVYTFRWMLDPDNLSPHRGGYKEISEVVAEDDLTVRFTLTAPHAPFLVNMERGIVPAHLGDTEGYGAAPVGSGPYRLEEQRPGEAVKLVAFAGYPDGAPPTEHLTFRVMPEDTVRLLAIKKGDVHMVLNALPPDAIKMLENDPRLVVERSTGTNYSYLGFNLEDPLLKRPGVRRAIAHAIDRDAIIEALYRGQARPATGMLTPDHWAYEPDVATHPFDPDMAKALLDEAGLIDPPGPEPRFSLLYKTSQNELTRRIGEVLQQQLAEVGIAITVRPYEWGTFYSDIKNGNFQIYTLSWVGIVEPDIFHYVFHSDSVPPAGANRGHYKNPKVDALLETGRSTPERKKRRATYREVQKILARDLPYVSLWHPEVILVRDRRLTGFELTPSGDYDSLARVRLTPN
ncbi:MAG: ABC transporter substrate-binding protein [Leptospirillia bacterium]